MLKTKHCMLSALFFLTLGCGNKQGQSDNVNILIENAFNLKGQRVTSIDSVTSNNTNKMCRIIFLFNYYDCSSCIDLGFSITNKIDSLYKKKIVTVISTMGNPTFYQKRNAYHEYVYSDSEDLIRKELKYVPTPILILLDSSNYIKDYILPGSSSNKETVSFIKEITGTKMLKLHK